MDLYNLIRADRPNINNSTINTYVNCLTNLCNCDIKEIRKIDNILGKINDKPITTQKNILTACIVALKATKEDKYNKCIHNYNKCLKQLTERYNNELLEQKKTKKQEDNWITYKELINLQNKLLLNVKEKGLLKKDKLNNKEFDELQQLIIIMVYMTFPIRNNFANMKVIHTSDLKNINKNDNYLVINKRKKNEFYINSYKTVKHHGAKIYTIPTKLTRIINQFLKHNPSGYFLVQYSRDKPLNSNNLTKYLNKIFIKEYNKKISTSMLRHIIISHMHEGLPTLKEEENNKKLIENKFLHSTNMNKLYRKV